MLRSRPWISALAAVVWLVSACEDEQPAPQAQPAPPATSSTPEPKSGPPARPARSAEIPKAKQPKREFVVVAGGDVNLGRVAGQQILEDPGYDPFVNLRPHFEFGDLNFVNLECPLSDQNGETQSPRNRLIFTGPPGGARVLANAGIDVVSVANNHAWDYRKSAFLETLDHLTRAGVGFVGGSREPEAQYEPFVFEAEGWSVALFAVTHIWNQGPIEQHPGRHHVAWARYDLLHDRIARAKREHDLVLFSYHGGGEYIDVPMIPTREFVEVVMQAGVDVLFGHHPHVVHGVSWFDGRPAFYSLGNLVFNQHKHYPWTGTGFLARVRFRRDAPPRVEACPYRIVGHTPTLFSGRAREPLERAFRRHLKIVSITVGGTSVGEPGDLSCMELTPPPSKATSKATSGNE